MDQLRLDAALPRRPLGYLSAPIAAPSAQKRTFNRLLALGASSRLFEADVLHYCPHANSPADSDLPPETWMAMDFEVIRRCDYIVMVGQWFDSPGCRRELALAMCLGLPVAYTVEAAIEIDRERRQKVA